MSDSELMYEEPSDLLGAGLGDGKERKLSVRFPEYHYKALKAYSASSGESMNKVIIDAVGVFCAGFFMRLLMKMKYQRGRSIHLPVTWG